MPFTWANIDEKNKWEIVKYVLNVEPENIWKNMYINNIKVNEFNINDTTTYNINDIELYIENDYKTQLKLNKIYT